MFRRAARLTFKARPYSGEIVTLAGHSDDVLAVAAAPDGSVITGADDSTVKVWRDGVCECTIEAHDDRVMAVAVLHRAERIVSVSHDGTAKLWTLDGALERTFEVGGAAWCVAALPDGAHFVVGLGPTWTRSGCTVDTLVHIFKAHTNWVRAVAVTPGGQHIISGSSDELVKVSGVASKSLVSTFIGHTKCVTAVATMPDGSRIVSGSDDGTVATWLLDGTLKNV